MPNKSYILESVLL